jgi:deazaflavin-dependent oxidoreductase (nitroreductase family)
MATFGHTPLTRAANRMLTRMVGNGRGPGFIRLLTVTGRRTGVDRTTPVVPVVTDRGRWLVSPYGEVGWVRNARAAGRVRLTRGATP